MYTLFYILQGFTSTFLYYVNPFYHKKMKKLFKHRISLCESCILFKKSTRQCSVCDCFMDIKTKCIFKLDKEGHALMDSEPACPLKKW